MAATNYTPISLYYSATASATPTAGNLVAGELAINTNDGKLFYKDSSGVVQTLASKATTSGTFTSITDSGLTSGRVTFAGTGGLLSDSANLFWDNTNARLGIGTSSPTTKLTIDTNAANYTDGITIANSTNFGYGSSLNFANIPSSGGSLTTVSRIQQYYQASNLYGLTFSVYNSALNEAMRIDTSGNLLVGTTSTTLTNGGILSFPGSGANSYLGIGHSSSGTSGSYYEAFNFNGTAIGSITQSGTTAVLYNVTSDQRLKENIIDAPSGNINDIKVRSFDWIADGTHQTYGMVAQELAEVAPYAVHQPIDPEEMMAVDYSKLVPMMIKEIQDLKKRIATLEK